MSRSCDRAAREAAFVACLPRLRAYALGLARNRAEADDLVQEAILRGWQSYDTQFGAGTNLGAWLATILRNAFFDMRRRRRREVPQDDDPGAAVDTSDRALLPGPDGGMPDLMAALDRLSDAHREVLVLVVALGHDLSDVAAMTGLPLGTVKSRLSRARARLEAELADR